MLIEFAESQLSPVLRHYNDVELVGEELYEMIVFMKNSLPREQLKNCNIYIDHALVGNIFVGVDDGDKWIIYNKLTNKIVERHYVYEDYEHSLYLLNN